MGAFVFLQVAPPEENLKISTSLVIENNANKINYLSTEVALEGETGLGSKMGFYVPL